MDDYRSNDAEPERFLNGDPENEAADRALMKQLGDELRETYVLPLDATTRAKHLAAISRAMSENLTGSHTFAATQRLLTERGRCAPASGRAAGSVEARTASAGGLASPFATRSAGTTSVHRLPTLPPSAGSMATSAPKRWSPLALVDAMSAKAAAIVAMVGIGFGGLAIAGDLPRPVQTAFAEAGGVVGLDIPSPMQLPVATPAPGREEQVPAPSSFGSPEPPAAVAPSPAQVPAPVASAPAPAASSAPQTPVVAPAKPPSAPEGDFESWMSELIRQAIAAHARAQNQPSAGTGQPAVTNSGDSGTDQPSWHSYSGYSQPENTTPASGSRPSYRQR